MVKLNKGLAVGVFAVLFTVLLIGNAFNISDYDSVSYNNNTDVFVGYPDNGVWANSSTENVVVENGSLTPASNDYSKWVSKPLRINDNRKIVYDAALSSTGNVGVTVQVSDNESFEDVSDIQSFNLQHGFNDVNLDLDSASYTRIIIEFDKAASTDDRIDSLNIQGSRVDLKTGFSDVLDLVVFLLLFWFGIKVFGNALGWWN